MGLIVVQRRLALLICNGNFDGIHGFKLVGPAKDAERLKQVLTTAEAGFQVECLCDGGLYEVRLAIARACRAAQEGDTLLIYYSGNGLLGPDGALHLLVADSDKDHPEATGIDAEFILTQLRGSKCTKIAVFIDANYGGGFFARNRGVPDGLYAITSCGANEMCGDSDDGGFFTMAVCDGLTNAHADIDGDGLVSVDELHEYVKEKLVAQRQAGTPLKWVWNVPEPIYLAGKAKHVVLSYAREDKADADRLVAGIEASGIPVWIDRAGIKSGNWKQRIIDALKPARAMLLLLSKNSLESDVVQKELGFAVKNKVPILPVQLTDLVPGDFPDWYTFDHDELQRHQIDPERMAEGVKLLVAAIRAVRESATTDAFGRPLRREVLTR